MVISIASFADARYRQTWLLCIYLFAMFIVLVALLGFIVFAFTVTNRGSGQVVMSWGFLEYQLFDDQLLPPRRPRLRRMARYAGGKEMERVLSRLVGGSGVPVVFFGRKLIGTMEEEEEKKI